MFNKNRAMNSDDDPMDGSSAVYADGHSMVSRNKEEPDDPMIGICWTNNDINNNHNAHGRHGLQIQESWAWTWSQGTSPSRHLFPRNDLAFPSFKSERHALKSFKY